MHMQVYESRHDIAASCVNDVVRPILYLPLYFDYFIFFYEHVKYAVFSGRRINDMPVLNQYFHICFLSNL